MTYKIQPMSDFTNIVEKQIRKSSLKSLVPALLYAAAIENLQFVLTDTGFFTTEKDYKKIVKKALYIIQNN